MQNLEDGTDQNIHGGSYTRRSSKLGSNKVLIILIYSLLVGNVSII